MQSVIDLWLREKAKNVKIAFAQKILECWSSYFYAINWATFEIDIANWNSTPIDREFGERNPIRFAVRFSNSIVNQPQCIYASTPLAKNRTLKIRIETQTNSYWSNMAKGPFAGSTAR